MVIPPLAAALLVWMFPLTLAAKFLPVAREPVQPITSDPDRLQEVGFSLLGLWLLCTALVDGVYWAVYLMTSPSTAVLEGEKANMFATMVEAGLGIWLLLGSRGLISAIHKLRRAGR